MNERSILEQICQASSEEIGNLMRGFMRECVIESFMCVVGEEVISLCGAKYHPDEGIFSRAGSAPGILTIGGLNERIIRPRVRKKTQEGSKEFNLKSYRAASKSEELHAALLRALMLGVSSRDQARLYPEFKNISKSSVSRLWLKEGLKFLEKLRGRDLSGESFFALMLDGIELSSDLTAVAALGVTLGGDKMMLDFEIGSSESKEVCDRLLTRLSRRGFKVLPGLRLLCIIDGSKALKNSLLQKFDDPVIQRCLIHKERNVKSCLSRRNHAEATLLFKDLRESQGAKAGREKLKDLRDFLAGKNKKALDSLEEGGEDLIALHVIDAPSSLNVSLLSTNCIENSFKNVRRKIGRVNRWRAETDQAERWLAYALMEAERGFRRIRGHGDIPLLVEKLNVRCKPDPAGDST